MILRQNQPIVQASENPTVHRVVTKGPERAEIRKCGAELKAELHKPVAERCNNLSIEPGGDCANRGGLVHDKAFLHAACYREANDEMSEDSAIHRCVDRWVETAATGLLVLLDHAGIGLTDVLREVERRTLAKIVEREIRINNAQAVKIRRARMTVIPGKGEKH